MRNRVASNGFSYVAVRPIGWVLAGCIASALLSACGDDDAPATSCRPGTERTCSGARGCEGTRRCAGDPPDWGACECTSEPPPPRDAGQPRDAEVELPVLGAACGGDDDCPNGAFCSSALEDGFFRGAPVAGTCVADCSAGAGACDAFDNAICVETEAAPSSSGADGADAGVEDDAGTAAPTAFCFERCELGAAEGDKCHGAAQVACAALGDTEDTRGYCRPVCSTDAECGDRACDRSTGACVAAPSMHDGSFGAPCDPGAEASTCEGLCLDVNESGEHVCSHRCVFGSSDACVDPGAEGVLGGCVVTTPSGGIGDVGYCLPLCDCAQDCPKSDSVCDPFEDEVLERTLGALGVCTAPEVAIHQPIECL